MPTIIDSTGRREVTQQEYDVYIASVSPTLQDLKQYKLTQLEEITQKYISSKIFHEIERSVRTGNAVPVWVNEFTDLIIQKNHNLRLQINRAITINELSLIDINLVAE
jgi:hypothetical protein